MKAPMTTSSRAMSCAMLAIIVSAVAVLNASASRMLPGERSRYDIILSRMPFGAAPVIQKQKTVEPTPVTVKDPNAGFANHMRICVMSEGPTGLRVGIVDAKNKKWSAMLSIGEEYESVHLVEANYEESSALLQKGNVQQWIYADKKAGTDKVAAAAPTPKRTATVQSPTRRRPSPVARHSLSRAASQARYNRERAAGLRSQPTPPNAVIAGPSPFAGMSKQEKDARLREYNMDLIRAAGELGPPLPIRLTSEEDDQLVREGILAPQ